MSTANSMPPRPDPQAPAVLAGSAQIFREALTCESDEALGLVCLAVAEALTESAFGIIGELERGTGELVRIAVSESGWAACQTPDYGCGDDRASLCLTTHGLYGRILRDGQSLLTNDPSAHPDSIGVPSGHPPLQSLLGVPLIENGETIGLIALANRPGGYGPENRSALEGLAPAIVQAFRSKRAEMALRASERRASADLAAMTRLQALGHRYLRSDALAPILEEMVDAAVAIADADGATISLRSGPGDEAQLAAHRGFPPEWPDAWRTAAMAQGACAAALARGERVIVEDIEVSPLFAANDAGDLQRRAGMRALQSTPLISRAGAPLGILSTHYRRRHRPDERTLRLLDLLARQAADILERAQIDAARRRSEHRYRRLYDSLRDAYVLVELDGRIRDCNAAYSALLGYTADELYGRPYMDLTPPEWHAFEARIISEQVLARGSSEVYEKEYRRKDGTVIAVELRAFAITDDAGEPQQMWAIVRDITTRKQAEEALRDADRRKDAFLATLGHELRNPLAPIRNACEILKLKPLPDPTVQSARDMIDRQLTHLTRLVDDLLDVNRITRDKLQLRRERVTLEAVLELAVEVAQPLIDRAQQTLGLSQPPEPLLLDADPLRLAQVFSNLLTNASKFSPKGGRLQIRVAHASGEAVVEVADTGLGIPAEHLPRLFEMFHQVPTDAERAPSGLGIGLALAKGLVEMHGGRLSAHSDGLGRGSTFSVSLPLCPADASAAPTPAATAEPVDGGSTRVLLADDQADILESLAVLLRLYGVTVKTASNGLEALAAAERFRPDLVLLDIGMPGLDGCEVCRRLRAQPWGRTLTIIAITGLSREEDRARSTAAGFDAHWVKPVALAAVLERLAALPRRDAP